MANRTAESRDRSARGARRRLRIWMAFVLAFMCWAGYTLFDQMGRLEAKTGNMQSLQAELDKTKQQNIAYKQEIARLNDPEYVEQILRSDYHMIKSGETLYIETK